jgi:hypothetical protein
MAHQTKHRAQASVYVLSAALVALGTASLSALPAPAKAQQPTTPPPCRSAQPQPANAVDPFLDQDCIPAPSPAPAQGAANVPAPRDFTPRNQAQNRLQ